MIYLDSAATTQPLDEVMQAFMLANEKYYANPASLHQMGVEVNTLLERARLQIAQLLHTTEKGVIFTSGGTESNNLAIIGVARANKMKGKHIITTAIEHPSVLEAAKFLETEGFEIDYLQVDASGVISLEQLSSTLRKDTILVSIMHVNNEIGAIQPIYEAAEMIHAQSRAIFHVDAVQSFGKLPLTFNHNLGPDLISISAHKIHGLKGTGVVAMRKPISIAPYLLGGKQEFGLRSGTVAVPQMVAMAKAARLAIEAQHSQMLKYQQWQMKLRQTFEKFQDHVKIISPQNGAPHIFTFSVKGLKGEVIVNALQKQGIIVSTSSACSSRQTKTSHVIEALQLEDSYKKGVIRISFGTKLSDDDINQVQVALIEVMHELKGDIEK